jgi:Uncharacterized protein conserved in archaea
MGIKGRIVPEAKRNEFKVPLGSPIDEKGLKNIANDLVTVGDVVSLVARKNGIVPSVSVYDGYTERREMTEFAELVRENKENELKVSNPAGTITCDLIDAVKNALSGKTKIIHVTGEEDLAVLPFLLYADDASIIYGMPGKGMMLVTTSGINKKKAEELWNMMEEFE